MSSVQVEARRRLSWRKHGLVHVRGVGFPHVKQEALHKYYDTPNTENHSWLGIRMLWEEKPMGPR